MKAKTKYYCLGYEVGVIVGKNRYANEKQIYVRSLAGGKGFYVGKSIYYPTLDKAYKAARSLECLESSTKYIRPVKYGTDIPEHAEGLSLWDDDIHKEITLEK